MKKLNVFSKTILSTIMLFYFIRMTSALIPIIMIPYAARILDRQNFSLLMCTLAIGVWVSMLIGYGDKLSGVRNLALQHGQLDKITHIVSETLTAQSYLVIFSIIIFLTLSYLHITHQKEVLLWLAWAYGIAQGFNPLWIFQGIDKIKLLAYIEFFSNTSVLLLIFFILPIHPQYISVMLILILNRLLVNLIAYNLLFLYKVRIYLAFWHRSFYRLKNGFGLFFLIASVSLYTTLSTAILSFFSGFAMVGMFAGVEKLARGLTAVILPISQATIPHRYILRNHQEQVNIVNKYTVLVSVSIALFVAILLCLFAHQWVNWFLGPMYHKASTILKIFAWIIPCYVFSTILSTQYLIPTNNDNVCNLIYTTGGIISLILAILIAPYYGALGMSYVVLITELFVLISMTIAVRICLT